jgi:hypothetical protein
VQQQQRVAWVSTLRNNMKNCCTSINHHWGFTITGCIIKGESPNASNPKKKVISKHPTYHISHAQPTDDASRNGFNANYNALKVVNDMPDMPTVNNQNDNDITNAITTSNRLSDRTSPVSQHVAGHGNNQNMQ